MFHVEQTVARPAKVRRRLEDGSFPAGLLCRMIERGLDRFTARKIQ
jgi:hypothetical protein